VSSWRTPFVVAHCSVICRVLDAAMAELAGFHASFDVASFSLYEADDVGVWQLVSQFALSGA